MRHMLVGLGLRAFAALIAAFGLLMLELSAYFMLVKAWSAVSAAAIRIALAREPGHPEGDDEVAYIFVAPVAVDGRIDPKLWRAHRDACRVARQRPNQQDQRGHLVYHPGGAWGFHYDSDANLPDEAG